MNSNEVVMPNSLHLIRVPLILGLLGGFLLAFSSLFMEFAYSASLNERVMKQFEVMVKILGWAIIFLSLALLINRYLRTGFSVGVSFKNSAIVGSGFELESDKSYREAIEENIARLELKLEEVSPIGAEEKSQLIADLRMRLSKSLERELVSEIRESVKAQIIDERVRYLRRNMESSVGRLLKEVADLSRRGNLNLSIGSLATLAGFLMFGMMVLGQDFKPTPENFVADFVPRLSLIILIEVFAYFFLGLYKSGLSEIKYFQNEITNIESKYAAMEYAVQYGDKDSINSVLNQIAVTERNFLLKKGESTVLLEQDRISSELKGSLLQKLTDLIGAAKAPNR